MSSRIVVSLTLSAAAKGAPTDPQCLRRYALLESAEGSYQILKNFESTENCHIYML